MINKAHSETVVPHQVFSAAPLHTSSVLHLSPQGTSLVLSHTQSAASQPQTCYKALLLTLVQLVHFPPLSKQQGVLLLSGALWACAFLLLLRFYLLVNPFPQITSPATSQVEKRSSSICKSASRRSLACCADEPALLLVHKQIHSALPVYELPLYLVVKFLQGKTGALLPGLASLQTRAKLRCFLVVQIPASCGK